MIAKLTGAVAALALSAAMSVSPAMADGQRYDRDDRHGVNLYEIYQQRARQQYRPYRARRDYGYDRSCLAVARRGRGRGRSIGIVGEGYGRRACRKAMRKCNRKLDVRQSYGRNPFAACVIARRG